MRTALTFLVYAAVICFALHMAARAVFPGCKLLDDPSKYKLSRCPLPYPTGIASVAAFTLLFIAAYSPLSTQDKGLLAAIAILSAVSVIDDLKNLPAMFRLAVQIFVGFIIFASGTRIYTITNPFGGIISLDTINLTFQLPIPVGPMPLLSGLFTIAWLLLTINSFNWLDGIPGQVSMLSFVGGITLGLLSLSGRVNQPEIALMAFIAAGTALGSMVFDFPPNKTVMGDTGAMFFGFILGIIGIYAGGKVATAFLVMGVPLVDALFVAAKRIARGKSPFTGGRDHLHHLLIDNRCWTEYEIILLTVFIGSSFGITALFLNTFGKLIAIILLALLMGALTRYASSA